MWDVVVLGVLSSVNSCGGALAFFSAASAVAPQLASNKRLCFCLSSCILAPSLDCWPGLLTLCSLAIKFMHLNPSVESLVFN